MKLFKLPSPRRFKTVDDCNAFMAGDASKCIPERIIQGDKSVPNPEYVNARYELSLWTDPKSERKI